MAPYCGHNLQAGDSATDEYRTARSKRAAQRTKQRLLVVA